jgi:general stress protein YciG
MTKRDNAEDSNKSKRGFASMPEKKVKEIAKKGGESSHGGGRTKSSSNDNSESKRNPKR